MKKRSAFDVVKNRHITEKSSVLQALHESEANQSARRCQKPKYVFIVDRNANKKEISEAIEEIYSEKKVKVSKVNTILMKPKERTVRGRKGYKAAFKKAIVTLEAGDTIDDLV